MTPWIALLRGINVGGNRPVKMAALAAAFEVAGATDVRTYIQSGNVVFRDARNARSLRSDLEAALERELGLQSTVVVRSAADFAEVAREHPFEGQAPAKLLGVAFFDVAPSEDAIREFASDAHLPDLCELRADHAYTCWPNGSARSKLNNAWLDRQLGVVSTVRNWNTTRKLAAMVAE